MDVAGEVVEHGVGPSDGLGEDDPALPDSIRRR